MTSRAGATDGRPETQSDGRHRPPTAVDRQGAESYDESSHAFCWQCSPVGSLVLEARRFGMNFRQAANGRRTGP
jgi:hypothetical protein